MRTLPVVIAALAVCCGSVPAVSIASPGDITTIAGSPGNGPALTLRQQAYAVATSSVDGAFLYLNDDFNNVVRRLNIVTGDETVVAGNGTPGDTGDGGPATGASLLYPETVATDHAGNLFIGSSIAGTVRRVDAVGVITRYAGNGSYDFGGDGGPAVDAMFKRITDVATDLAGNVYIADFGNGRVRKVDTGGIITTVAGSPAGAFVGAGHPAVETRIGSPGAIAVDSGGNLFVATDLGIIWKIDPSGTATVFANASAVRDITFDGVGSLLVADYNARKVTLITPEGVRWPVAGTGESGSTGDGGLANEAAVNPFGMTFDAAGNLYIADAAAARVRRVTPDDNIITTVAGSPVTAGDGGLATDAQVITPTAIAVDGAGQVYFGGGQDRRVRRIGIDGIVTAFVGDGTIQESTGDGGPAAAAGVSEVEALADDHAGSLYIADARRLRRVTGGIITTVAGGGDAEPGDGGAATDASLGRLTAVALDGAGNVYFAEDRHAVRKVDAAGIITTVAGTYFISGDEGDGGPATAAHLLNPGGLAVDAAGNLYIADTSNNRIRKVDRAGTITTIGGTGGSDTTGDGGPATAAQIRHPMALAIDAVGNLYIGGEEWSIRKIDPGGRITTIAGLPYGGFGGDGGPAIEAFLRSPQAIALGATGDLFLTDLGNNRLRRIESANLTVTRATVDADGGTVQTADSGVAVDIPPGVFATPTPVSITTGLVDSAFTIGSTATNLVTLVKLEPEGVVFSQPVTLHFGWPSTIVGGVEYVSGTLIEEPSLKVFRNGVQFAGTTTCGEQTCTAAACCDAPNNTWAIQVTQFSEYAVGGPPCGTMDHPQLKATRILPPAGDDGLTLKGAFTVAGSVAAAVDPVAHGMEVRLIDPPSTALDVLLPPGAYDKVAKVGWKVNAAHTKWTYANKSAQPPGGISGASLGDQSKKAPGRVAFKITGKKASFAVGPHVRAQVVLTGSGQCGDADFPGEPAGVCALGKTSLSCK